MDVKRILLISLVLVAIVVSVSAVSAGLFDGLMGEQQKDNVIEIDNITFNTTNVTKFKIFNQTEEEGLSVDWYIDENDTGYNVHIMNYSSLDESVSNEVVKLYKDEYSNLHSEVINGIVVYTTTANTGNNVGEPRYLAYVENHDLNTLVDLWSPNPNETAKMASTLKFK